MAEVSQSTFIFENRHVMGLAVSSGPSALVAAALAERITAQIQTQVAFLNANLSNACNRDHVLSTGLSDFILLNDGLGIDIATRVLHGHAFPDNLNGTDLTPSLLDQAGHSWRIFLLGGRPEVVKRAAQIFRERWPQHFVAGYADGFFDAEEDVARQIKDSNPHLVLVAMGNPRQELWIAKNIPGVCNCAVAVGAWFDFLTGQVPRAPTLLRTLRLEWFFRLCVEPRRLAKRYLIGNVLFLMRVAEAKYNLGTLAQVAVQQGELRVDEVA